MIFERTDEMINVALDPIAAEELTYTEIAFLNESGFLGQEPGDDAAAILAQRKDGAFAFVTGAACPNNKRRAFPKLIEGKGLSLRLAGVTVFVVAPDPFGGDEGPVVLVGWDRRPNSLCATAQGGVGGGQSFLEGAFSEISDESFLIAVLNGLVVRIVPEDFPLELRQIGSTDNPFGVPIEGYVECGKLTLAGYHDHHTEGYVSAMYSWNCPGVEGMTPLLAGSVGTYNVGWQDARIPVLGSTAGQKVRIQGIFALFPVAPLLIGNGSWVVGVSQLSQGFMKLEADVSISGPQLHPTLQYWMESLVGQSL